MDYLHFCDMMNDVRQGKGFCFVPPLLSDDDPAEAAQAQAQAQARAGHMAGEMDAYSSSYSPSYGSSRHAPAEGKYDDDDAMDVGRAGDKDRGEGKYHK